MVEFLELQLLDILDKEVAAATSFHICTLVIFLLAITHTLLANHFTRLSERIAVRHKRIHGESKKVNFWAEVFSFFGEIEVIFGLWVIPLVFAIIFFYGWDDVVDYLNTRIYTEPLFIVVVMSLSSTRPIIKWARKGVHQIARLFGDSPKAWWFSILTVGPILGSIITEASAMTIGALLLKEQLYTHRPSKRLAYGTMGLMFVNFSVCGVLTNFAAPPALALSRCWGWEALDFFQMFGWRVLVGLFLVNLLYLFCLRKNFPQLQPLSKTEESVKKLDEKKGRVPIWISLIHVAFLAWTVVMAHYPPLFLGGYLLFLGFHQATRHHQYDLNLKRPLMVGLFLAGLVIHGGFQGWWIEPLLGELGYGAMMLTGTILTAFNENTTVAYLSCLVEGLTPKLQYALTSALVAGGGLTIIAHAPNPAGQALLRPYFPKGISQWDIFIAALVPTLIFLAIFYFLPYTA